MRGHVPFEVPAGPGGQGRSWNWSSLVRGCEPIHGKSSTRAGTTPKEVRGEEVPGRPGDTREAEWDRPRGQVLGAERRGCRMRSDEIGQGT